MIQPFEAKKTNHITNFYHAGKKKKGEKDSEGDSESEASARSETEEILDSILPPREWEEHGQLWRQSVSSTPATRLDVINLQEQLDQKLEQRQARETGICQVRRELYAQCFDELIRQCTINCVERGLLLVPSISFYPRFYRDYPNFIQILSLLD